MNSAPKDTLLKELLSGRELEELRASTLNHGLDLARRRRRNRRAARMSGFAAFVFAVAVLVSMRFRTISTVDPRIMVGHPGAAATDLVSTVPPAPSREPPAVRRLTDDQLLALFPGRPVALIGPPGDQTLVFLDQPTPTISPLH
jgi:hypothetical protein